MIFKGWKGDRISEGWKGDRISKVWERDRISKGWDGNMISKVWEVLDGIDWGGLGVEGISLVLHINSLISIDLIMHKYKHNLYIYISIYG